MTIGRSRDALSEERLLRPVESNVPGFESVGQGSPAGRHQGSRQPETNILRLCAPPRKPRFVRESFFFFFFFIDFTISMDSHRTSSIIISTANGFQATFKRPKKCLKSVKLIISTCRESSSKIHPPWNTIVHQLTIRNQYH